MYLLKAHLRNYIFFFLKIGVLLYTDDPLLLAENEKDMQGCLDLFNDYCHIWKIKVNLSKSKVVSFGARNTGSFRFKLGELLIETTDNYNV